MSALELDPPLDSITIDGTTYKFSEQSEDFRRGAIRLVQTRKMIRELQNEIGVLDFTRSVLRATLLNLVSQPGDGAIDSILPDTLSFEDAD